MRRQILAAVRLLAVLTLVLGVLYPLAVTAVAQIAMPGRADGSLVRVEGRVVGSALLGQAFTGPEWFHGRPDPYAPSLSGPSNLGPSNPALARAVADQVAALRRSDQVSGPVPADAVTGSGSGLDPHISPEYARLQVPRVAAARGVPDEVVLLLVSAATEQRTLGFLGEPRVNVLLLNVALSGLRP